MFERRHSYTCNKLSPAAKYFSADKRNGSTTRGNNLTLSLNDVYTSRVYIDVFNTCSIAQSGYWLANGKLNWSSGNYEFSLYANNLFDRHYFVYSLYEVSTVDLNFNLRGVSRQFGGEFTYRF
jgi:outer membrane receptor protein involved in Fe transport